MQIAFLTTEPVMSDNAFEPPLIQLANATTPSIIKVIGVGGGGGNAVGQMYLDNIPEVRYLVANTDSKPWLTVLCPTICRWELVLEPEEILCRAVSRHSTV